MQSHELASIGRVCVLPVSNRAVSTVPNGHAVFHRQSQPDTPWMSYICWLGTIFFVATDPSNFTVRHRSRRRDDTPVERLFAEVSHATCYSCFTLAMKGRPSQIRPEIGAAGEWSSRKGDDIPDAWRSAIQYCLSKLLYGAPFEEQVLKLSDFRTAMLRPVSPIACR
jgi:hypothetical protein